MVRRRTSWTRPDGGPAALPMNPPVSLLCAELGGRRDDSVAGHGALVPPLATPAALPGSLGPRSGEGDEMGPGS
jgi:hypothetical protein